MYLTETVKRKIMFLISCFFCLLILLQHHYVPIVFDDYGYASLSYGWTENRAGMAYTLSDIFKFLSWHYFNWGGRVLYFFFEVVILRIGGAELIQIVQAVVIVLICILSGEIIATAINCDKWYCIALSLMFYGTLNLATLRDGVYWYSASVAYVWPLLPLLGSIYFYLLLQIKESFFRKCMAIFLAFIAAFSQEQISVLVIVWIASIVFFNFWKERGSDRKKHIPGYMYGMGISAILGGMITVVAPGNFVRTERVEYIDFYNKNFLERIAENTEKIIDINIGSYNGIFVLIMTMFCGTAVALYLKSRKIYVLTGAFMVYFIFERLIIIPLTAGIIVRLVWTLCFLTLLLIYYYMRRNYLFLGMLVAGICSQGVLLISPTISIRCHTMMEFILHIVVAESIMSIYTSEMCKMKKIQRVYVSVCMLALFVYSIFNFENIITGYKENDEIIKINHYKLTETAARYKVGDDVREVDLYKLYDDSYSNCMPYQDGFDYIEVWMKNYYELPQDIYFTWHNIKDSLNFYVKSGEYYADHWLGREAEFSIKADEERILKITATNLGDIENQQIICTIAGNKMVYDISKGETCSFEIAIPAGESELSICAGQIFIPTNGDSRELSVLLDFMY